MNLIIILSVVVSCVLSYPISQPVYPNNQYVSGQTIPTIQFKPQAQGYLQPQYALVQPARPVFQQQAARDGLQHYSTQSKVGQPIQQVLSTANVDRQVQRIPQLAGPLYLHQIQAAQQQSQEAVFAAQRKPAPQTLTRPVIVQQQPQTQYSREQPQIRYVSRPAQYTQQAEAHQQQQQQQQEQQQQQDPEDYDPNPAYQFGFDVKDDLYTNYQNRKEQREGNKITGSYSVVDSDGFVRTVTYTADPKEGFKAQVTRKPTDIVVKIPKPDPQFQQQRQQPQQYIQALPVQQKVQQRPTQQQHQGQDLVYQFQ